MHRLMLCAVVAAFASLVLGATVTAASEEEPNLGDLLEALTVSMPEATSAGDETASVSSTASAPFRLETVAHVPTTEMTMAVTERLKGAPGDTVLRIHATGDIALSKLDGETVWSRPGQSFYTEGHPDSIRQWGFLRTLLGVSSGDPRAPVSEDPYAMGDVNGDGVDDVALTHWVFESVTHITPQLGSDRGIVTLLDGRDGRTLWRSLYAGRVTQVAIQAGRLIVGQESGPRNAFIWGADGTSTTLHGLEVTPAGTDGGVAVHPRWSVTASNYARWLAIERVGADRIAAAWSDKPLDSTGDVGRLLMIDAATGAVRWSKAMPRFPRVLRYDSTRDELVAGEQHAAAPVTIATLGSPDLLEVPIQEAHLNFDLVAYGVDGTERLRSTHADSVLQQLDIGDVDGDDVTDWVIAENVQLAVERARISALSSDDASTLWFSDSQMHLASPTVGSPDYEDLPPVKLIPHLDVAKEGDGARIVVGGMDGDVPADVTVLDGATGLAVWRNHEPADEVFPLFPRAVLTVGGTPALVGLSQEGRVRALALEDGSVVADGPILAHVNDVAVGDVNGDGTKDFVLSSDSGGVYALDGKRLGDDPGILWRYDAKAGVHDIELADLDRDGNLELVMTAAGNAREFLTPAGTWFVGYNPSPSTGVLETLDAETGQSEWRHEFSGEFAWTMTIGDIAGDPKLEVLLPTTTLRAFAADGTKLWSFAGEAPVAVFSNVEIGPDRKVVSQFGVRRPMTPGDGIEEAGDDLGIGASPDRQDFFLTNAVAIALDGETGEAAWQHPFPEYRTHPQFKRGVLVSEHIPGGSGFGAAFAHDKEYRTPADDPTFPNNTYTRTKVSVLDVRTGELAYEHEPPEEVNAGHEGIEAFPAAGFVHYLSSAFLQRCIDPTGERMTSMTMPEDLEELDFGRFGRALIAANGPASDFARATLTAFRPTGLCSKSNPMQQPDVLTGQGYTLHAGKIVPADIDGDGVDEIVTVPDDFRAEMLPLAIMTGKFGLSTNRSPMGLSIVRARSAVDPDPTPTPTPTPTITPTATPTATPTVAPTPESVRDPAPDALPAAPPASIPTAPLGSTGRSTSTLQARRRGRRVRVSGVIRATPGCLPGHVSLLQRRPGDRRFGRARKVTVRRARWSASVTARRGTRFRVVPAPLPGCALTPSRLVRA